MTEEASTRISIAEDTAPASSNSGQVTDFAAAALIDSANPWPDSSQYWRDEGFTQPGDLAYAPFTYSFGEGSLSTFPTVFPAEDMPVQASTSAAVPDSDVQQPEGSAAFDYGAALQDELRRQEQAKESQLAERASELHRRPPPTRGVIPFPSLDAGGYREDRREEERQRVRSMGASSQRGTRKESGRRDSEHREGLRATEHTESLEQMKALAFVVYRAGRYKPQSGLSRTDADEEEDPKWFSELLAQKKPAADRSKAKSKRGGRRSKK